MSTSHLAHVHDRLPISWFNVKNNIEEMTADYISYEHFQRICQEHEIRTEENQKILIGFLHDLGVVLNFQEDIRLQETNILNPEWVTEGVYRILNSNILFQNKGVLYLDVLRDILDCKHYPVNKHLFIIDMMRKFELCFDFEGFVDQKFLVPDLLSREEPYTGDWQISDCLGFQYHYNVLPGSVISRFIVRTNSYIFKNTYWRNGVVLTHRESRALVRADPEERIIFIYISGNFSAERRELLAIIRANFEHIHRTIPRLEVKEKVPLPDHPRIAVDHSHLLNLERMGETSFIPQGLTQRVSVQQLLDGVEVERKYRKKNGSLSPINNKSAPTDREAMMELSRIKEKLDLNAQKHAKRMLWLYFLGLAALWLVLAGLTYRLGWNLMEPWTYFLGLGGTIGSYLYFVFTKREFSPRAIYERIVEVKSNKNYRDSDFDLDKYETLLKVPPNNANQADA